MLFFWSTHSPITTNPGEVRIPKSALQVHGSNICVTDAVNVLIQVYWYKCIDTSVLVQVYWYKCIGISVLV